MASDLDAWQELAAKFTEGGTPDDLRELIENLQEEQANNQQQIRDLRKRESELLYRVTDKENDANKFESFLKEIAEHNEGKATLLRATYMDPLVNKNFAKLEARIKELEAELKKTQEDMQAVTFNSQTVTGQKLISKCRRLQEENKEFGVELADGKIQRLQTELAIRNNFAATLNESQIETNEFVLQLEDECERLQAIIFDLQNDNRVYKDACEQAGVKVTGLVKRQEEQHENNNHHVDASDQMDI